MLAHQRETKISEECFQKLNRWKCPVSVTLSFIASPMLYAMCLCVYLCTSSWNRKISKACLKHWNVNFSLVTFPLHFFPLATWRRWIMVRRKTQLEFTSLLLRFLPPQRRHTCTPTAWFWISALLPSWTLWPWWHFARWGEKCRMNAANVFLWRNNLFVWYIYIYSKQSKGNLFSEALS